MPQALGLAGRASFFVGDWTSALSRQFDAIVANPPYIATAALAGLPREVREHDPRRALDGGADGLAAYRAIAPGIRALLAPAGILIVRGRGWPNRGRGGDSGRTWPVAEGVERDLAGIERCVVARKAAAARAEEADGSALAKKPWNVHPSRLG